MIGMENVSHECKILYHNSANCRLIVDSFSKNKKKTIHEHETFRHNCMKTGT